MTRLLAVFALAAAVATPCFFSGCGSIESGPAPSSTTKLSPNPVHIYVGPVDGSDAKWLVGQSPEMTYDGSREGIDLVRFKEDFTTMFEHILVNRLNKLAPTEERWVDDLPDHGWLVQVKFLTVDQGSRFLRTAMGDGFGKTTLQTRVYVYDLSVSKTQYLLSFLTGVRNPRTGDGAGSGNGLSGLTAPEPVATSFGLGSGLKQDSTRTANTIADVLAQYK